MEQVGAEESPVQHALKDVPIYTEPLRGYIRLGDRRSQTVEFQPNSRCKRENQWKPTPTVWHAWHDQHPELFTEPTSTSSRRTPLQQSLEDQLQREVQLLQDIVADTVDELHELHPYSLQQQQQHHRQQQATWRDKLQVVPVWEGHHLHQPGLPATQQMLTVVAGLGGFSKYSFIGWYLGVMLNSKQHDEVQTAYADPYWEKWNVTVKVETPDGAVLVSQQQRGGKDELELLVDAANCLEGNPLAQLLDYRQFAAGWQLLNNAGNRQGPNVMFFPFSFNSTGKVYVAVVALRDIAAGQELLIDYGPEYWAGHVALQQARNLGLQEGRHAANEEVKELKQQLKVAAAEKLVLKQAEQQLRQLHLRQHVQQQLHNVLKSGSVNTADELAEHLPQGGSPPNSSTVIDPASSSGAASGHQDDFVSHADQDPVQQKRPRSDAFLQRKHRQDYEPLRSISVAAQQKRRCQQQIEQKVPAYSDGQQDTLQQVAVHNHSLSGMEEAAGYPSQLSAKRARPHTFVKHGHRSDHASLGQPDSQPSKSKSQPQALETDCVLRSAKCQQHAQQLSRQQPAIRSHQTMQQIAASDVEDERSSSPDVAVPFRLQYSSVAWAKAIHESPTGVVGRQQADDSVSGDAALPITSKTADFASVQVADEDRKAWTDNESQTDDPDWSADVEMTSESDPEADNVQVVAAADRALHKVAAGAKQAAAATSLRSARRDVIAATSAVAAIDGKYRGVSKYKSKGLWKARVSHQNKMIHIGYFETAAAAARAHDWKRMQLFQGQVPDAELESKLNYPLSDYKDGGPAAGYLPQKRKNKPRSKYTHVTYDKVSKLWQAWSSAYSTSERCQVEQSTGGHVGAGATSSGSADQCLKPKHGLLGLFEDDLAAAVAVDLDFVSRLKSGDVQPPKGKERSRKLRFPGLLPEYGKLLGWETPGIAQDNDDMRKFRGVRPYPENPDRFIAHIRGRRQKHIDILDDAEDAARLVDRTVLEADFIKMSDKGLGRVLNFEPTKEAKLAAEARGRCCRRVGDHWHVFAESNDTVRALAALHSESLKDLVAKYQE